MSDLLTDWLGQNEAALVERVSERLLERPGTIFRSKGAATTRSFVASILHALRDDLAHTGSEHLRSTLIDFISSLRQALFAFQDLRLFAFVLRDVLLSALDQETTFNAAAQRRLEDWLHHVALHGALYFIVQREEIIEEQASQIEVRLAELQSAHSEQSRLLEMIREISIPIAPVFDGILVVPLVGTIDAYRAQSLMEHLLESIVTEQAMFVILDISGVPIFDTNVAQRLLMTARAASLLGARVIAVGLSAETAQAIVHLGIDLADLVTRRNLQEGLAYALSELRFQIVPTSTAGSAGISAQGERRLDGSALGSQHSTYS